MSRGPYVSENGPEVYLPVSDYSLNEARREAASHAWMTIGSWGRSKYDGKLEISLHDHDEPWDGSDCDCPREPVWAFSTYEGTYRR